MRASLPAKATVATLRWTRAMRPRSHAPSGVLLLSSEGRAARAPWISNLRKYLFPRLVMASSLSLPPVVTCRGTSPSHAARSRPRAEVVAFPTAAARAVAISTPMPGMSPDGVPLHRLWCGRRIRRRTLGAQQHRRPNDLCNAAGRRAPRSDNLTMPVAGISGEVGLGR